MAPMLPNTGQTHGRAPFGMGASVTRVRSKTPSMPPANDSAVRAVIADNPTGMPAATNHSAVQKGYLEWVAAAGLFEVL